MFRGETGQYVCDNVSEYSCFTSCFGQRILCFVILCQSVPVAHFMFQRKNSLFLVKVTHRGSVAVRGISAAKGTDTIVKLCFIASITLFISSPSSKEMRFTKATTYIQMAVQ